MATVFRIFFLISSMALVAESASVTSGPPLAQGDSSSNLVAFETQEQALLAWISQLQTMHFSSKIIEEKRIKLLSDINTTLATVRKKIHVLNQELSELQDHRDKTAQNQDFEWVKLEQSALKARIKQRILEQENHNEKHNEGIFSIIERQFIALKSQLKA